MRQGLNIDGILAKPDPTKNEILTYLQYTLNIAELCRRNFNADETRGYDFDLRNYTVLLSRIRELLARLKYDVKYISDKEVIYLVTKDGGKQGGFEEKREAARRCGAELILVARPEDSGISMEELMAELEGMA